MFGIELINEAVETRINLAELADEGLSYNPYKALEFSLNHNPQSIFFFSILKNRLSDKVKRGSIVKALAIASSRQNIFLESLTKVLEGALNQIFDQCDPTAKLEHNMEKAETIISDLYTAINSHDLRGANKHLLPRGDFL
jgi:hypothetical protein